MFEFIQKIRRIKKTKQHKLTVFEISLFALLLAIYIIAAILERFVFKGIMNINITYAVFIIFGLALGPWKGAFLGILCDTLNQVIRGISTWMIEYALVPVFIALISGWLLRLMYAKQKITWIIGFSFLSIITAIFVIVLTIHGNNLPINETAVKRTKLIPIRIVLSIAIVGLAFIWISSITFLTLFIKNRKFSVKSNVVLLFSILLVVFFTLMLCRWFWGPFAYINYHNRFRSGNWDYKTYYPIFMIPIIAKTLIEIPIYTAVIFVLYPIIIMIRQRILFYTSKIYSY
ncbi:ECF transporter S component [Metamycoplasma hominis]|uniref:ECF transporter S component n=1 Tax=Metamycoplasma hominis TaxID=2098 RepID=UPI000DCB7136|nr:ECF transporter S component [Metamycoplasma hominis]RAW47267.1 ECF transporter S component [Metamycoplasma hominis]